DLIDRRQEILRPVRSTSLYMGLAACAPEHVSKMACLPCSRRRCCGNLGRGTRGPPQQLGHVARVEAGPVRVAGAIQRLLELGERVPAALGMRVVSGEHEQLRACMLD